MKLAPRRKLLLLLPGLVLVSSFTSNGRIQQPNAHTIITGLFKSIASVKTLTYELDYVERKADGKLRKDSSLVKFQKSPLRIYMKMSEGNEILWGPDMNSGDALVHPNSFPYFNLNLNPDGSTMRKNQHHGIDATGYDYFGAVLQNGVNKVGKNFDNQFLYLGEISYNGYRCYYISVLNPDFKYLPYTVQKGENIITIARKFYLNEFMILVHNHLSTLTDVKPGQTIMVPSDYGKIMTLYIDKVTMLPVLLKVEDDMGMFEEYHYFRLKVNSVIPAEEFTRSYKGYHF